jgi:hypothetical protein
LSSDIETDDEALDEDKPLLNAIKLKWKMSPSKKGKYKKRNGYWGSWIPKGLFSAGSESLMPIS